MLAGVSVTFAFGDFSGDGFSHGGVRFVGMAETVTRVALKESSFALAMPPRVAVGLGHMTTQSKPSTQPQRGQPCPCGSGQLFEACCEPILSGLKKAPTAEKLMRARFVAHVAHDFKFLHDSYLPDSGKPYVAEEGEPAIVWTRLDMHGEETNIGGNPDKSYVDFSAYGTEEGIEKVLHEKSEFLRVNGQWFYNREMRLGPAPVKSSAPKVGRNDPCPCGSGKKYKQCCLAKA